MTKEKEQWKPVKGFEGIYEVSDRGRVKAVKREVHTKDGRRFWRAAQILSQHKNQAGIHRVSVSINGTMTQLQVPDLVLEAFVRPRNEEGRVSEMARFKDGDRSNNHVSNLEWVPRPGYRGKSSHCKRGHKFVPENLEHWAAEKGINRCLACARARQLAHYHGHSGDQTYIAKAADREYLRILENANGGDLHE